MVKWPLVCILGAVARETRVELPLLAQPGAAGRGGNPQLGPPSPSDFKETETQATPGCLVSEQSLHPELGSAWLQAGLSASRSLTEGQQSGA